MEDGFIVGYDPGGQDAHGFARIRVRNGRASEVTTTTAASAEEVLSLIAGTPSIVALGVDTLTCWSTGPCAWRPADRWLRANCKPVQHSIMSPNGLAGSMGMNGMAVLIEVRRAMGDVIVTETHPKILYWHLAGRKYDFETESVRMTNALSRALGVRVDPKNDHEWDAALSAYAALEGVTGRWPQDLHMRATEEGERIVVPCGPTRYYWPTDYRWPA